jgi:hypothetical protein
LRCIPNEGEASLKTAHRTLKKHSNNLDLPFEFAVQEKIARRISDRTGHPATVLFTDNASIMISFRKMKNHRMLLRLHHMFCEADEKIINAVAEFVRNRNRESSRVLNDFIKSNKNIVRHKNGKCLGKINTCGKHHSLGSMYQKLNHVYFGGKLDVAITWGRKGGRKPHRNIRLGSYSYDNKIIRIHPALDKSWVPGFFVESVVYHEMLHAHFQATKYHGRMQYHTPEFHRLEKRYTYFQKSTNWEKQNVKYLL